MTDHSAQHYAARSHDKMREVLMHPEAPGPAVHYHMTRGGSDQRNVTTWEPGPVGRMGGFAYFVVEKNGKPALVRNPRYRRAPELSIISASAYPLSKPA